MTLVEILVAISIIIIMASIPFLSRKTVTSSQKLSMTSQKLVSDIRKMQSFVLNMKDHNGSFPEGGWGIVIYNNASGKSHYTLFADMDGTNVFDDGGGDTYRDIELPSEIVFFALNYNDGTAHSILADSRMIISFQPPDPSVTLCETNDNNGCDTSYNIVQLVLSNSDATNFRTVEVNAYGLVDIKNN